MAKNNCRSIAGPSSSPRSSLPPARHTPRSRRRRSPPRIVAFLATLSTIPFSVHAHPLDPPQTALPFLYPPFILQPTPSVAKRSHPSSTPDATTSAPSQHPTRYREDLPDKYVQEDDGLWYKSEWTLYGRSQCTESCLPTPSAVQDANSLNDPMATDMSPATYDDFDVSSLPEGWNVPNNTTRRGMILILSLSVALAVTIIAMMIICVIWRRKFIPKKDPEKRWRQSSDLTHDDTSRSIREAKAAQRRWTKSVSQWRTNARFSFRRRRTGLTIARTATFSTEGEGIFSESGNSASSSRSPSPTPTVRSRPSTNRDVPPSSVASVHSASSRLSSRASSPRPQVTLPYSVPPPPASPIEPPAYHPQLSVPAPPLTGDHSPPYTHSDCCSPGPSKPPLSSCSTRQPNDGSLSGHVATDDKTLLSRRAALASAPLDSSSHFPPSAPSMEDDYDFELLSESRPPSPIVDADGSEQRPPYLPPSSPSLLPPPPSKGKLKYEYSDLGLNYDIANIEPGLGPSAPPFEETEAVPSAPPVDPDVVVPVPSAPAMGEDDRQDDAHRMDAGPVMALPGNVSFTLPGDGGARPASEVETVAPSMPHR